MGGPVADAFGKSSKGGVAPKYIEWKSFVKDNISFPKSKAKWPHWFWGQQKMVEIDYLKCLWQYLETFSEDNIKCCRTTDCTKSTVNLWIKLYFAAIICNSISNITWCRWPGRLAVASYVIMHHPLSGPETWRREAAAVSLQFGAPSFQTKYLKYNLAWVTRMTAVAVVAMSL